MKIAYICADPGIPVFGTKGASVHVQEIIRAMRRAGHDVHLYATRRGDQLPADLADLPADVLPVVAEDPAARELATVKAAEELAQRAITDGADLIYERYSLFSSALAIGTARLEVPGILEVNAPLIDEQRRHRHLVAEELARDTLRRQVAAATATVCVSEPVSVWVAHHACYRQLGVIPNGVSLERFTPHPEDPDGVVVAFVGTLKPWHGVEDLLAAAALASGSWRLRIIGDGPLADLLKERAAGFGLDVDFRGAIAPDDVPAHLAGSAIGVAPYPELEEQYFSPLKALEYMAAGLPVVASEVGQLPLLLGDAGRLVPPSDPAALARAIDALAADPEARVRLGAAGRARAAASHSWDRVLQRSLDLAGVGT